MPKVTLENLGAIVREKRGGIGLRAAAADIGTSAPTLSRIESGKMPDLQTFIKLCRWLEIDPASIMGVSPRRRAADKTFAATAHLRANREIAPETAKALANAIIHAQRMLGETESETDEDGERV